MLDLARTYDAVGGAVGVKRANALTYRMDTLSRVACFFIGDSNALKDGYGLLAGLAGALKSRFGCFGTGVIGAKHYRPATSQGSGMDTVWPNYGDSTLTNAVRNKLEFTAASWTNATLTLTGTFTGYTPKAGDIVTIWSGTSLGSGVQDRDFVVQAGSTVGSIILDRTIGASASNIAGVISNGPGASSFSFMPDAIHDAWNMPRDWIPLGATSVYHASGSHFVESSILVTPKWSYLSCNSRLQASMHWLALAGGGTQKLTFGHCSSVNGLTSQAAIATGLSYSCAGTDGVLSHTRLALAAGDRVVSAYGSREYFSAGINIEAASVGPSAELGVSIEDMDAPTGVSMSGFLCKGGHSAYDMALIVKNFLTDNTIKNFLGLLNDSTSAATGGGGDLHAVGFINTGFNDHIATTTSLGTAATDSSTAAGYKDNIVVIMDRLQAMFTALKVAGAVTADSTLTFVLIPSHPISDSPTTPGTGSFAAREALTQTYRQAVQELSLTRGDVIAIDLFTLLGPTPFSALYNRRLTYSNSGTPASDDVLHLTAGGYRWLAGKIISAMDFAGPRGNYVGPTRMRGAG